MTDACFVATGVALLMPADSAPELAVLLGDTRAPDGVVVALRGHRLSFVRMRHGPLAHGVVEPYRQREVWDQGLSGTLEITEHTHGVARLGDAGRLFGSGDVTVLIPRDAEGGMHRELTIPSGPIGRARRMLMRRGDGDIDPVYEVVEELEDPGWVCRICGRLSPDPEPHTSAHGVPGHLRAGALPGEPLDETRTYAVG
ncbi:hypothetical protein GCM10009840_02280 [Pseudolysinimonas kribbensis]|uniref:C2H2-type domain-containing protein n=1 Tax=Pseudolysinimonas kribbensis TaxID=433641 RepID=A0ABQ6K1N4_9MICO|nr:hypothetical protein [Pseudolysinimonas kribbensis]GMA94513.1 hypothetical protein GCM10025881_13370 [Pseudolysinimonas kribbensis]